MESNKAVQLKHHMVPKNFDFEKLSIEDEVPLSQNEFLRSPECPLLINGVSCAECGKLEVKLRSQVKLKRKVQQTPAHLNAPIKFTSPERVLLTIQSQRVENKQLKAENDALKERIEKAVANDSVPVDKELNTDLINIFKGIPNDRIPPSMKLFWEEQQKYLRTTIKSQIRYHPAIIKYCLSIAAKKFFQQ